MPTTRRTRAATQHARQKSVPLKVVNKAPAAGEQSSLAFDDDSTSSSADDEVERDQSSASPAAPCKAVSSRQLQQQMQQPLAKKTVKVRSPFLRQKRPRGSPSATGHDDLSVFEFGSETSGAAKIKYQRKGGPDRRDSKYYAGQVTKGLARKPAAAKTVAPPPAGPATAKRLREPAERSGTPVALPAGSAGSAASAARAANSSLERCVGPGTNYGLPCPVSCAAVLTWD